MVGYFETRKDRPAVGRVTVDNGDETVRLTIYDNISAVAVVDLYPDEVLKLALRLFGVVHIGAVHARRRDCPDRNLLGGCDLRDQKMSDDPTLFPDVIQGVI
jgi:hypothetical protein